MKRVDVDGVPHRWRRGKLVPIPERWVGQVTHSQTIRKRPSKAHGGKRVRKAMKHNGGYDQIHHKMPSMDDRRAPTIEEWA